MAERKDIDILRELLDKDAFVRNNGISYEEVRGGYCRVRMTVGKEHLNFLGAPHGGAVFTVGDAAFAGSCNGHGELAVAVSVTVDFVYRPVPLRIGAAVSSVSFAAFAVFLAVRFRNRASAIGPRSISY